MKPLYSPLKRILMTADTVGGVWTYALELARSLGAYEVEVALATMGARMTREQRSEARSISNLETFESTYRLEWMDNPWDDVAAAGDWLLGLEQRLRPDVVHLNGYAHGALRWRAPVVVVGHSCVFSWWRAVHGDRPISADWNPYRQAVKAGLQAARLVVAPSRAMLSALSEHYGPLAKAGVISNGRKLPLGKCQPKEKFVLTAGRFWDAAKNIGALTAVAPALPWPLYVAGERTKPRNSEAPCKRVHYLGRLSSEELWPWFARASIYALPARYEPFGLSVLEAGLDGCALVLGDIPSLRETWDGAALFVAPGSPQALCQALKELMANPARLAGFAARARRVASVYTPERMASRYLAAYGEAMRRVGIGAHQETVTA